MRGYGNLMKLIILVQLMPNLDVVILILKNIVMNKFKISIFILAFTFLLSCEENRDESLEKSQLENQVENQEIEPGQLPKDHPFYSVSSSEELLQLYRKALEEEVNEDYYNNLRHLCLFSLLKDESFYSTSTKKEQLFILKELASMEKSLPNVDNFYRLLTLMLENESIPDSTAVDLSIEFRKKNELALQKSTLKKELIEEKKETLRKGDLQIKKHLRYKGITDLVE